MKVVARLIMEWIFFNCFSQLVDVLSELQFCVANVIGKGELSPHT
jgi:hypothetical protein